MDRLDSISTWAIKKQGTTLQKSTADELMQHAGDEDSTLVARAAELYLRAGDFQQADDCIEKLIAMPNLNVQEHTWLDILRGARAVFRGQPFSAIPHLMKALYRKPSDLWTLELLALAYEHTGAFHDAAEFYRRILVQKPQSATARLALARLVWKWGNPNEASTHIDILSKRSIRLTPNQAHLMELIRLACELVSLVPQPNSKPPKKGKRITRYTASPGGTCTRQRVHGRIDHSMLCFYAGCGSGFTLVA